MKWVQVVKLKFGGTFFVYWNVWCAVVSHHLFRVAYTVNVGHNCITPLFHCHCFLFQFIVGFKLSNFIFSTKIHCHCSSSITLRLAFICKILNWGCNECLCTLIEPDLGICLSLKWHSLSCFQRLSESHSSTQCAKYNLGKYFLNNQNWRWESHWEPCEVSVVECGTWHRYSVPAHWAARQLVGRQTSTL